MRFIGNQNIRVHKRAKAVTLLLTLLVLVLAVTVLGRQVSQVTRQRLSSAAQSHTIESQWIAEGVVHQWQERSRDASATFDDLLVPARWELASNEQAGGAPVRIEVWPSSAHNKLFVPALTGQEVLTFWNRQSSTVILAPDLERCIFESGNAALEVILDPIHLSAKAAYFLAPEQKSATDISPTDRFTVWGDGKVDVNRCPLDVMGIRLKTFTSVQLSGILRVRKQAPILRFDALSRELSLSEEQQRLLQRNGTLQPSIVEMIIRIQRGGLRCVYHGVFTVGSQGQVLEVRPIL